MTDLPVPAEAAIERWLRRCAGYERMNVRSLAAVTGGASNLTYRVALSGAPLAGVALRLQREDGIFAPYDVAREARVVAALAPSAVPVPTVIGVEMDTSVLGAPFAVYEWVDAPHFGEARGEGSYPAYVAAVADIHALDWRSLGLDFLGVPESATDGVRAEVEAIIERAKRFGLDADALIGRAARDLLERIPRDGALALCQGDVNAFNYLFRAGRVAAVVDWEQARISDPRSDVGQMLALGVLLGQPLGPAEEAPFARAYAAITQRPLHGLAFFRARWLFELVVIHHLWRAYTGSEPWYALTDAERLLERALAEGAG